MEWSSYVIFVFYLADQDQSSFPDIVDGVRLESMLGLA